MPGAPNNSVLQYVGKWVPGTWTPARDVISAVSSDLLVNGIAVRSTNDDSGLLQNATPPSVSPFTVKLVLQVQNGLGFGDVNDVISIIRHWVLEESGHFPLSDSIPTVQVQGQTTVDTGQPSPPPPSGGGNNNSGSGGFLDEIAKFFSDTTSAIGISALLLVAGLLVAKKEGWV